MKDLVTKFSVRSIFISLALLFLGIIIVINAKVFLAWVIIAIGILLLIDALIRFASFLRLDSEERSVNFDIIRAVLETVLGIVAVVSPASGVRMLYILAGVIVVAEGILHLQFVLTRKNELNHWFVNFIISLVNILCGVFIIAHPILTSGIVNVIIGTEIIISSVLGLFSYIYFLIFFKKLRRDTVIDLDEDDYTE